MRVSLLSCRLRVVFAIIAGLFLLGTFATFQTAYAAPNDRSTLSERYEHHYCATNRARFADADFCDDVVVPDPDPDPDPNPDPDPDPEPEPEAPTVEVTANPLVVMVGETTELTWSSEYADSCEASGDWSGAKSTSGSQELVVNATSTYVITCTGEGGEVDESVTVAAVIPTEPEPDEPTLELSVDPSVVPLGSTATLSWSAYHVDTCEAFGDWGGEKALSGSEEIVVATTSTYTLVCTGEGVSLSKSIGVAVTDPEPEPSVDHLLISEVLYDLGSGQGSEVAGRNEWVEIYNPTNAAVDLAGWTIGNGTSDDVISDTSLMLEPGEYMIITNATSTADFWDLASTTVVYLGSSISGGLSNTGDVVILFDAEGGEVDAISWSCYRDLFDPCLDLVSAGSSVERTDLSVDTDTASDWSENVTPTPGA